MRSDFVTFSKQRHTTYTFSDKPIKPAVLKTILEAARWTPSARNIQPWEFVVVKNKNTIKKLLQTTHRFSYPQIHPHPAVIIVCTLDLKTIDESSPYADNEVRESHMDIGMAALNIVYAAQDNNIASCLLTPNAKNIQAAIKLKKGFLAPLMIGLGHPQARTRTKTTTRKPLSKIVFSEKHSHA